MSRILDKINSGYTYFDGGYGTLFQARGLKPGELPEVWNITHPEAVIDIHYEYICAGSDIIETNTFGANSLKFGDGISEYSLEEIIKAAVENVRAAKAKAGREDVFVALSMGPLGKLLEPLGDMEFERAVSIFNKTASIAISEGVDLILIETMNDIYEAKAAILGCKEAGDIPVFLTCAFDESGKLLTGADPKTVVTVAEALGVSAVGVNCSVGPRQMVDVVREMSAYASVPVICNPNAGIPRVENGKTVFDVNPKEFADAFCDLTEAGAIILGGCCGTTPDHIRSMKKSTCNNTFTAPVYKDITIVASYTHSVEFADRPVLIGERINPTGKKLFKQALRDKNMDYILNEGLNQVDNGAHVLDVNVGLPEIDEVDMMRSVVAELQAVVDLPLQIDTTNAKAMETALRMYNGKAMINSVNGKQEVMEEIFPLVAKYGGLCVALTLDESGIPDNAEDRVAIVERIVKKAAEYGIKPKDIIVDPLCMSISADAKSANVTLESLRLLRDKLHLKTTLGVSNISFGLPRRELINSAFFTMAMENGLGAAIMNPGSIPMMNAYLSFNALKAIDTNCTDYIEYAANLQDAPVTTGAASQTATGNDKVSTEGKDALIAAIIKGLKDRSAAITADYLNTREPIDIIDSFLIPALDTVGQGFEKQTLFLPQLLMSAEAAGAAFEVIKKKIASGGESEEKKGSIIVATVKGDIHDIGKNIVKVLLENYGYEVIDLGKDVPPELIVSTAKERAIKLVGLSALMTTTVPSMEETIRQLRAAGLDCKVCVGGAVLTQEYADMIGADKYTKDAMETVRYAEELFAK